MEHAEKVILTNLCMIQDGTKVLVEEKVGKGAPATKPHLRRGFVIS